MKRRVLEVLICEENFFQNMFILDEFRSKLRFFSQRVLISTCTQSLSGLAVSSRAKIRSSSHFLPKEFIADEAWGSGGLDL